MSVLTYDVVHRNKSSIFDTAISGIEGKLKKKMEISSNNSLRYLLINKSGFKFITTKLKQTNGYI